MQKQLTQIWITYWLQLQSVIAWVVLAFFIILLFAPRSEETWETRKLAPTMSRYDSSQSQYFRLSQTPSPPNNKPISQLTDLKPTTRALLIESSSLTELDTAQLKTLPHLQQLTLSTRSIPEGLLTTIAPNLTELKIHSNLILSHTDELSSLSNLKLLVTDNQYLNPTFIQSIAQIPNLQALVITDKTNFELDTDDEKSTPGFNNLTASDLSPLLSRPITIYANWSAANNLPQQHPTAVFPYFVNNGPITMTYYCWAFLTISWLSIITHLNALTRRPASRLLPNFASPHLLFTALALCFLLLITCSALKTAQVSFTASLTASLIPITICSTWNLLIRSQSLRWLSFLLAIYLFSYLSMHDLLSPYSLSLAQNLLTGHFKNIATISALVQFSFITAATIISTRNSGDVPDSQLTLFERLLRRNNSNPPLKHNLAKSFWKQVLLLRTGNNSYTGLSIIGLMAVNLFIYNSDSDSRYIWTSLMAMSMSYLAGQMPIMGSYWQNRQKFLEQEFLAPRTRSQFAQQLLTANALEHLWLLTPYAMLTLFGFVHPLYRDQAFQTLTAFPALLSCLSLFLALNLNFLIFRKSRFEYFITLLGLIIASTLIFTITIGTDPKSFNFRLIFALISLVICLPISAFFINIAYRYTLNYEWGQSD